MRPINDKGAKDRLGLAGLPDRDNPFAWKQKTREGKRGARELLVDLSDDEVARYMAIASDQVQLEERLAAVKVLCAVCGIAVCAAVLFMGLTTRFSGLVFTGLGLGLAMVYWPWRVFRCRQLWQMHYDAARAEQVRRQSAL